MAKTLNYYTICQTHTLAQIEERISFYQSALEDATVKKYAKDTTQGVQSVESAELPGLESLYQTYLQAKLCKTGQAGPNVISGTFNHSKRGF